MLGAVAVLALVVVQAALAGDADPRKQPLEELTAADNAGAKASLLQRSDLASLFQVQAQRNGTPPVPACATYPGDRSDITITGSANTSYQLRGKAGRPAGSSLASSVFFFKTASDSDRYWQKTVRLQYLDCLAASLTFGTVAKPVKPRRILFAKQIAIGLTGADKAVAYQLIADLRPPRGQRLYWTEMAVFVKVGRGIAVIRVIYFDNTCSCQTSLARDAASRLTAAAG